MVEWSNEKEVTKSVEENSVEENQTTSHNVVIQRAHKLLAQVLDDPFLSDLSEDCGNVEGARSQLALLEGRAITILIKKFDGQLVRKCLLEMCRF